MQLISCNAGMVTDTLVTHRCLLLQSTASFSSSVSDWGSEEHVSDLGIKLQPGTPLYQVQVDELHPTQLCVGMQQVRTPCVRCASKLCICVQMHVCSEPGEQPADVHMWYQLGFHSLTFSNKLLHIGSHNCRTDHRGSLAAQNLQRTCISLISQAARQAASQPANPPLSLCLPAGLQVHEKMKKLQKKQDKGPDALNK